MLTPRLECILRHITSIKIADIGTDHAYIPIELAKKYKDITAIACDIKSGPLAIATANIEKYGFTGVISTRLGSGLNCLCEGEVDEIIIAGMGGILISQIIEENIHIARSAKKLILQPMNAQDELRRFLIENSFSISNEDIAIEGFKVYNVFDVQNGVQKPFLRDIDYSIPPTIYSHKYVSKLLDKKMREFSKIASGIEKASEQDLVTLAHYNALIDDILKIKKELSL